MNQVSLLIFLRDRGMILLWLLMIVIFAVLAGQLFFSFTNAMLVLGAAAVTAIFAAAVAFGVVSSVLDLSVPGTAAFASVIAAQLIVGGAPVALALLVAVLVGIGVGVVNWYLSAKRGLNPLVVTIATLTALTGLSAVVAEGVPISGLSALHFIGTDTYAQIPAPAFVVAVIYLLGWLFLTRFRAGVRLMAVGGNAEAVRRVGIAADRYKLLGFALSGVCAAIGGVVSAAVVTQASPTAGTGVLFDALTAVALSGMALTGGRGSFPRVLIGALIIATINNGLVILNVQPYWTTVATGALLIIALGSERILTTAVSNRLVTSSTAALPVAKPAQEATA